MMSGEPILVFRAVERVFRSGQHEVHALGPIDLSVGRGEFVAIMGPSGSGKSTFLALAGALDKPTAGEVLVHGQSLAKCTKRKLAALRRKHIGKVFQEYNLLPGLTALENVALPLELDGRPWSSARAEAADALRDVGLAERATHFPEDLSGGERQRVAVARAFIGERSLLLADEPTGSLDSVNGERILRVLRERADQGRTVVLVTHDASHAAWADRVLWLRDGRWDDTAATPQSAAPVLGSCP